ncbi:MAG: cupin domain-containing protein [Spirochaetaceae bacterium]
MDILNLSSLEVKSKNSKVSHYNIKTSVVDSSTFGANKLGFDVKVLEPGQLSYPYHYHSDDEEIYIIIDGEVTLRQNNESSILLKGDMAFIKNSKDGAHQLYNHSSRPVRYLGVASKSDADICFYPDSNKINAGEGQIYKQETNVDYYDGEESIPTFWDDTKKNKI